MTTVDHVTCTETRETIQRLEAAYGAACQRLTETEAALVEVTGERDRARDLAVRLEAQLARIEGIARMARRAADDLVASGVLLGVADALERILDPHAGTDDPVPIDGIVQIKPDGASPYPGEGPAENGRESGPDDEDAEWDARAAAEGAVAAARAAIAAWHRQDQRDFMTRCDQKGRR